MLLPGPEAMQLATWIGWRVHGTLGGLIAGLLFVLPGAAVVLALSMIYAAFGQVPLVAALFTGVQAAVVAVVIEALLRVSKRALKSRGNWIIAALAFAALFIFGLPFPIVILTAGLYGYLTTTTAAQPLDTPHPYGATIKAVVIWGTVWLAPLALLVTLHPGLYADIGVYFSKLAVVTFGGAYAVLAWMTQSVVTTQHWLTITQMMDGLGLAETTPGPLILVTEFVAYVAAHQKDGLTGGPLRCCHRPLDDLRAMFSVDLRRRTLDRPPDRRAPPVRRAASHHRRRRRGHRQSVTLVRAACLLCPASARIDCRAAAHDPARPDHAAPVSRSPCPCLRLSFAATAPITGACAGACRHCIGRLRHSSVTPPLSFTLKFPMLGLPDDRSRHGAVD